MEGDSYQLKPMNCPFHIEIFKQGFYSYRDLPLRWAELGTVYRYERSGTMQGLFRVRGFTQVLQTTARNLPCPGVRAWGVASQSCHKAKAAHSNQLHEWDCLALHCPGLCLTGTKLH